MCKLLKYFWYSVNLLLDQNYELIKMLYLQTTTVMLLMATTINLPAFIGIYPHMVTFEYLPVEYKLFIMLMKPWMDPASLMRLGFYQTCSFTSKHCNHQGVPGTLSHKAVVCTDCCPGWDLRERKHCSHPAFGNVDSTLLLVWRALAKAEEGKWREWKRPKQDVWLGADTNPMQEQHGKVNTSLQKPVTFSSVLLGRILSWVPPSWN